MSLCFNFFSYRAFDGILSPERYDHLRYLAFAAHLIEASNHDELTHLEISDLLQEFNERYENLYTVHLPFLSISAYKLIRNFIEISIFLVLIKTLTLTYHVILEKTS
jgi:hypothetical protein